ncbi:MAG: chorismate-binding protein [Solirubrobacterales bacterium]|nr:chorismate-binding protein [Solirubrobacterales bacterium]
MSIGHAQSAQLWREPIDLALDPGQVLLQLRDRNLPFALTGTWAGGGAILGSDPIAVAGPDEDPFATLDRLPALTSVAADGAVGGGWFGWLGYGAGAWVETLPPQPPRPAGLPQSHLAFYDNLLRLDGEGRWWFEALLTPEREAELGQRVAELKRLTGRGPFDPAPESPVVPGEFRLVPPGADGHLNAIRRCQERIRSGEFFQANLRVRLESVRGADLAALFAAATDRLRPACGAAFLTPQGGVASLSPELFLRRTGDLVETGPIKGTAVRPDDPEAAELARRALVDSAKDAAEHVMIVDVARNDLGRVCLPGTVVAPDVPEAEPHPGLWHLVSRVKGRIRPGVGDAGLLRATFPPCSVTGAPKIQAMRAIAELEPLGREVFTGAIGYASPAAGLELNVAIRTFEASGERLWLDVGGGIVADSVPERELVECFDKARPLIEAIGSRIGSDRDPGTIPPSRLVTGLPFALDGERDRPDPAAGVIETVRVESGRAEHIDLHLARLASSLDELYEVGLSSDAERQVADAARTLGDGGLRVRAMADGSITVETRPFPSRELPVELTPFILPGGLGSHKWADRGLLDELSREGSTPLLIDLDGTVLEAGWGNVWMVEAGRLITPPTDGRILPGVTRKMVLRRGSWEGLPVGIESFGLDRMAGAGRILVSSSLAGLVPARLPGKATPDRDR